MDWVWVILCLKIISICNWSSIRFIIINQMRQSCALLGSSLFSASMSSVIIRVALLIIIKSNWPRWSLVNLQISFPEMIAMGVWWSTLFWQWNIFLKSFRLASWLIIYFFKLMKIWNLFYSATNKMLYRIRTL